MFMLSLKNFARKGLIPYSYIAAKVHLQGLCKYIVIVITVARTAIKLTIVMDNCNTSLIWNILGIFTRCSTNDPQKWDNQ